jgi:hypothetical protein
MNNFVKIITTMQLQAKHILIFSIVFLAAITRLIPHPFNFSPIGAIALFGAATIPGNKWKIVLPLVAMYASDLLLNNTIHFSWYKPEQLTFGMYLGANYGVYLAFILIGVLGTYLLKIVNFKNVVIASLSSSVLFYLVTNFEAWVMDIGNIYSNDISGLLSCYVAGLPFYSAHIATPFGFLGNTIFGDLFYCGVLFGVYSVVNQLVKKPVVA